MNLTSFVVVALLFCSSLSFADIDHCSPTTDLVCHQAFYSYRNFFVYCIDTVHKKISQGSQMGSFAQQELLDPAHPRDQRASAVFKGSLPEKLEIKGASYGSGSGKIIQFILEISQSGSKYSGKIKIDGDLQGDLDCHPSQSTN